MTSFDVQLVTNLKRAHAIHEYYFAITIALQIEVDETPLFRGRGGRSQGMTCLSVRNAPP